MYNGKREFNFYYSDPLVLLLFHNFTGITVLFLLSVEISSDLNSYIITFVTTKWNNQCLHL